MREGGSQSEVSRQRRGLRALIAPVTAKPLARAGSRPLDCARDRPVAPGPVAVREKVLECGQFERDGGRREDRPAEVPRQERNRADLDDESPKADGVEDTPPPEINPHITVCELCGKTGSRAPAWGDGFRAGPRQ